MKIIVGLGNPGAEYETSRHNVGFMAVELLSKKLGLSSFKNEKKFFAHISEGTYVPRDSCTNKKIILVKPDTFMNNSGESVQELVNFYHCAPADLWTIYDDIDLPLGTVRMRKEGSAGTHNGMRSIIERLGFTNFPRLRIGIESRGALAPEKQDLSSFVLHPFSKEEMNIVSKSIEDGVLQLIESL